MASCKPRHAGVESSKTNALYEIGTEPPALGEISHKVLKRHRGTLPAAQTLRAKAEEMLPAKLAESQTAGCCKATARQCVSGRRRPWLGLCLPLHDLSGSGFAEPLALQERNRVLRLRTLEPMCISKWCCTRQSPRSACEHAGSKHTHTHTHTHPISISE